MKKKTGKRTRIRWTVLLLLSICLTLGACSAKKADTETSPQDTAKYAMEALKQLDLETWNRYTDNYVSTEKTGLAFLSAGNTGFLTNCFSPVCGREKDTSPTTVLPRGLLSI